MNLAPAVVTSLVLSRKLFSLAAFLLIATTTLHAADKMPLSQVQKGMKGYGLTVFEGTTIEKFDVEILGVLNNIGPDQSLILAKVDHPVVARAGVIAGMSGSPVFIDGKVSGALAYAWQFAKEPVAGITPIDEMLKLSQRVAPAGASPAGAAPRMTAIEMLSSFARSQPEAAFNKLMANNATPVSSISGAKRIALPLSLGSFSADTLQRFTPQLEQLGFVAVPAGAASSSTTKSAKTTFELGDPIGAVLLSGDFNVASSGTVSYVDGKNIYAFGHPFLDMGEINFPMATSEVVTVMPSVASSFKFSNTGDIVGV
ncbi:MAG TPA: SpoIVB peptidase S55 domain-containing protein, partial [Thermoanaerobaculia bacterium]|nr:SpoIVB peptidase S55 domain-containing protein [Thermoanaerobaculia bacterium]